MANPLFNAIAGRSGASQNNTSDSSAKPSNPPTTAPNGQQMTMLQDAMRQLQSNPAEMIKQAGFSVPDEYANDPRAAAMHIIQSGQVKGPVMQRIQPMLNMLMGRR